MKELQNFPTNSTVGPVSRRMRGAFRRLANGYALRRLALAHQPEGRMVADVVRQVNGSLSGEDQACLAEIEDQRQRLLRRVDPLVDGTLGPGGLYDEGVSIESACRASKRPQAARLLYLLIRTFKPSVVLELGTNLGISAAYQAAALRRNGHGVLVTLEASPYRTRLAQEVHRRLHLTNVTYVQGLFAETLAPTLRSIGPVDFSFIDGHHQFQPTLDYFDAVWRHSHSSPVFVFDDIRWSAGMAQAWSILSSDSRLTLVVDLDSVGVCLARPARRPFRSLRMRRALSSPRVGLPSAAPSTDSKRVLRELDRSVSDGRATGNPTGNTHRKPHR
jgi:predicted O-methyltransferase YrrM